MRPPLAALALAGLAFALLAGCFVSRRSDAFACTTNADCDSGRDCVEGYCVVGGQSDCPSACTSCDMASGLCEIDRNSADDNNVHCPFGFDCVVRCNAANGCPSVDCGAARQCEISCTAAQACGSINCAGRPCQIACDAEDACDTIDCAASCRCDVDCKTPADCPDQACPRSFAGDPCTIDGTTATACDSSRAAPGCDTCP